VQRPAHVRGCRVTLFAVLRHRFREHVVNVRRHRSVSFARLQQWIGLAVHERRRARQSIRWFDARHQVIERRGECIEIAARISSQTLNLFEGRIVWCVTEDTRGGRDARDLACLTFCETEVEQNDLAARSKFQILRFDVTMDDLRILCVQVVERVE